MQVAGCRLQVAGCRLQVEGCGLQVAGCGLQVAGLFCWTRLLVRVVSLVIQFHNFAKLFRIEGAYTRKN